MTVDFSDYFWGEKNEGFNALYQNMKAGLLSAKELAETFREMAKIQEDAAKGHLKILNALSPADYPNTGTFSPVLAAFRVQTEKLATVHNAWMIKLTELVKEVSKYHDDLAKTHKRVKDEESAALEAVKVMQDTTTSLLKAKDNYKQRTLELEKLRRDQASVKELDKSENKFKRAQDEYKNLVERYCAVRDNFERKMEAAAKHFQGLETTHVAQLREFVENYLVIVDSNANNLNKVQLEFQVKLTDLTVANLLEQFCLNKMTGFERPGPIEFEESVLNQGALPSDNISDKSGNNSMDKVSLGSAANVNASIGSSASTGMIQRKESSDNVMNEASKATPSASASGGPAPDIDPVSPVPPPNTSSNVSPAANNNANEDVVVVGGGGSALEVSAPSEDQSPARGLSGLAGFLRRRQKKKKNVEDECSDGETSEAASGAAGAAGAASSAPDLIQVDKDGYSMQPNPGGSGGPSDPWADFNQPSKSFYSSSDESDDETKRKIKINIKPINGEGDKRKSATVDELQKAVGGLELVPPPLSRLRPRSALNERIGTQTLKLKPRDSDSKGSSSNLRRSLSQTQVNKPSDDLAGLRLHPIDDPIDEPNPKPDPESSSPKMDVSVTNEEVKNIFQQQQQQPQLPPKQQQQQQRPSSVQREQISNSLIALPRPPSRHGTAILNQPRPGRTSTSVLEMASTKPKNINEQQQRANSESPQNQQQQQQHHSSFGTSRGPSPLTLSNQDVVPLAVAFQEVCHACFRGVDEGQCQVRLIGDMMISFPAGIVPVLAANPNPAALIFRLKNAKTLDSIIPNKALVEPTPTLSTNDTCVYEFKMDPLKELLKKQAEQNPKASYFNIDILKYQVKPAPGAGSTPLQMVAYWKCTPDHTDLRLDYKYNGHAISKPGSLGRPPPLLNLSIAVPVDGGVKNMQSKPNGTWITESNRALWKFPELSSMSGSESDTGVGSLRARFELTNGPGSQGTIAAQFNCEGTTLSGVDIELAGPGYRLSLVKRRFVSGKYICDSDASGDPSNRYAAPP